MQCFFMILNCAVYFFQEEEESTDHDKEGGQSQPIRTVSCLKILLHDVTVDLNLKPNEPLAKVNFIKSRLTVDSYSDETQDVDLVSQVINEINK